MKTKNIQQLLIALFALLSLTANAQESKTLAEWTFETGYTVEGNVYTPNTEAWAQVGWNGFGTLPQIRPNTFTGEQTDYAVSAKGTRFWGIMENYTEKILSLYQDMDPNNITDYADASQHNQYFEVSFPTKGYEHVELSFAFTCGDNTVRSMEMVVSTDGGTTWADAGSYEGAASWWTYKTSTAKLSANNKEKVIVRLIAANGVTAQWRMNTIKITAEEAEPAQVVDASGFTATWSLKENDIVKAATTSVENLFSISEMTWGEKLTPAGLRTDNGIVRQQFQPTEKVTAEDESAAIIFALKPKKSLTFTPKKLSFKASKVGTNGGKFDVVVVSGSETKTVGTGINPQLAKNSPYVSVHEFDLSEIPATDDVFFVKIYIMDLADDKQYAFSDVTITGDVAGTLDAIASYTLTTDTNLDGAGTISCNPAGGVYDEGTDVKVTVKRNLGYKFQEWQDGDGQTVSTSESTTVTMDADKTLTAIFTQIPVYTITTKVTNDADRSLGSVTLSPNDNNGKYEEGTEITATANESRILKFLQWTDSNENAGTNATRSLTVNSDMELVANYEVQEFLAVYDASKVNSYAYETTAVYPFAADLAWDDQRNATASIVNVSDGSKVYTKDGGTPVVRNRGGVVMAGINGLYQNGYRTTDIAWQYQFSTKGFTAVKFYGDMAAKNMASKNWKALVSTDGTNFTAIDGATWEVSANVIKAISFDLPASAENQDMVYVRITGDGTDDLRSGDVYAFDKKFLDLDYCDHSEAGVGNVYVMGEAQGAEDTDAPAILNIVPADGATGISASGRITVSYDERIKAVEGATAATLNGEALTPSWSNRSVSFEYFNLAYGESYTFVLPAGYVQDKNGNVSAETRTVTFTVMERQQPTARTFDAIVDGSLEADVEATADMPAQYKKLQDAIDAAPTANSKPYLIYIKEGYYNDPNTSFNSSYGMRYTNPGNADDKTTEQIAGGQSAYNDCRLVYVNKPNIHLIGQAVDKVTIAGDRLDGACADRTRPWYHVNAGATMEIQSGAKDFYMENITVDNENWTKMGMAGPQALAMNISADRTVINNCNVRSYQDTYFSAGAKNRQLWYKTTIEGAVDFIYGDGDVFFESCKLNINRNKGGYIVAPSHVAENTRWGYVFNNTTITTDYADPSTYQIYLGRPWHNQPITVFLHTQMEVGAYDGYWYETMGGLPALWAVYDIWDKNGNKMSETSIKAYWYWKDDDKTEKVTGQSKNSLTADEAAQYTLANVMAGDRTSNAETGVWNPLSLVEKTEKPVLTAGNGEVTWEAIPYAICYVVTVNGKAVAFPTATTIDGLSVDDVVSVQSVNEYGALSEMSECVTITNSTGINTIDAQSEKVSSVEIYTIDGKLLSNLQPGLNIVRQRMADGSVKTIKMIK